MIYENNEEKRSTIWRTILTVSSVLIIIIAAFFIIKLFTGNPLEGTWISEDSGAVLEIGDDGELTLKEAESGELQCGYKDKDLHSTDGKCLYRRHPFRFL